MNQSTKRIILEYLVVAALWYILFTIIYVSEGLILENGIIFTLTYNILLAIFGVGYYQCFIVDYLGLTDFSFNTIKQFFGRLGAAISRSINDGWVWFLVKLIVFGMFGWAIGLVRAILRIKWSLDE